MFTGDIKKLKGFLLCILLIFSLTLPVKAAQEAAQVKFGEPLGEEENLYKIPLCIYGNRGIMGYYITITKTSGAALITGAERGRLTEKGIFDFRVSKAQDTVEILWAGLDEVSQDGEMLYLILSDSSGFEQACTLTVSYSQADTFDEEYRDVKLDCYGVSVKGEKEPKVVGTSSEPERGAQAGASEKKEKQGERSEKIVHELTEERKASDNKSGSTERIEESGTGKRQMLPETDRRKDAPDEPADKEADSKTTDLYQTGDDEIDGRTMKVEEKLKKAEDIEKKDNACAVKVILAVFFLLLFAGTIIRKHKFSVGHIYKERILKF